MHCFNVIWMDQQTSWNLCVSDHRGEISQLGLYVNSIHRMSPFELEALKEATKAKCSHSGKYFASQ